MKSEGRPWTQKHPDEAKGRPPWQNAALDMATSFYMKEYRGCVPENTYLDASQHGFRKAWRHGVFLNSKACVAFVFLHLIAEVFFQGCFPGAVSMPAYSEERLRTDTPRRMLCKKVVHVESDIA